VVCVVFALAVAVGAPALTGPPDPTAIRAYPRPDWYLLWYYAVLALLPPGTESWVIVLAPLLAGALLLSVPFLGSRGERAPSRRPWAVAAVVSVVTLVLGFWIAGARATWSPDFSARPLTAAVVGQVPPAAARGATLFHERGCEFCHAISGSGGHRGPDLTRIGAQRSPGELMLRIMNGGRNMPGFAASLSPEDADALVRFLETRR
jgi:ubiquinol-cytochrome c reductase cytochrome b subunit